MNSINTARDLVYLKEINKLDIVKGKEEISNIFNLRANQDASKRLELLDKLGNTAAGVGRGISKIPGLERIGNTINDSGIKFRDKQERLGLIRKHKGNKLKKRLGLK